MWLSLLKGLLLKSQELTSADEDVDKGNACTLLVEIEVGTAAMENGLPRWC